MMINPCTVIGLLISLVALVFVSLEASVKKFVEVFIPFKPEANSTEFEFSCSIAGLGVYITEYDSSCLSAELLAASRVPAEKFTAPTTTFKLLFPAQENFVAEVLPVNAEILDELDKAFGGGVTQLLGPDVTAIQDTTFKNCEQYMGEIETKMLALFSTLNDKLLNQVVPQIVGQVAAALSNPAVNTTQPGAILSIGPALSKGPAENPLNALMAFTYFALLPQGLAGFCSLVPDDILTVLDAGQLQCISNIYAGAAAKITSEDASEAGKDTASLLQVLSGQATGLSSLASVLNITFLTVAGSVGATFSEGGIFEEVTVTGIPGQQTPLCLVWSGCKDLTLTKAQLVQKVFAVLTFLQESTPQDGPAPEFDNPFAEAVFNQLSAVPTGFGAYALSLVFVGAPLFTGTNATDVELANAIGAFSTEAIPPPFPDTFSGTYIPCALLQFVETAVLSTDLEGVPNFPETCDFAAFWPAAAAVAGATQNSLAPVLESLALLYGACNSFQLTPGNCDLLFPSLFINGAYGSELDLTAFAGDQHAVFTQAIAACDDDETDKEKIGGAQVLLSLAIVLYALTPLSGGASLAMNRNQHIVLILTGFLSILAFALNMGALLLVSSAPVYEDVGGDPTEFTPVYREGIVVTFGKVAMGLGAGAGACFFVAACVSCKAVGKVEESKEMVPVEDAVAPPKVDVDDVKQTV